MVFDIQRYSLHDGPGIRTTVFLKGCPLRCSWCHNPESQAAGPELAFSPGRCVHCGACADACLQRAIAFAGDLPAIDRGLCTLCGACPDDCCSEALQIVGRQMTVTEIMDIVEEDVPFYDESDGGVTFSGGEPLSQPRFLLDLLRASKEREIHTTVDTCGYVAWEDLDEIRSYVDLFLYDVKLLDDEEHRAYTGVSNEMILRNLRRLAESGQDIVVRVPLIPGINDAPAQIHAIGRFAAGLPGVRRLDILPYHHIAADKYRRFDRIYDLVETRSPSSERIAQVTQIVAGFGLDIRIGG